MLPQMFSFEGKDGGKSAHQDHESERIKNVLAELEQLLVHSNIPVSEIDVTCFDFVMFIHISARDVYTRIVRSSFCCFLAPALTA